MKTATLTVQTRSRNIRVVKALVRVASFLRWRGLAAFALHFLHVEYRVERGPWQEVPHGLTVDA